MQKITILLAAATLAGLASGAIAQETPAPAGLTTDHVAAADPNKDGAVSQAEYEQFMEVTFVTLDVNKDGFLEWSEAKEIIPLAAFKAADTDANNALARAEFDAQVAADFTAADKDGDGALK